MVTVAADILADLAQTQPRITRVDDRWGSGRYNDVEGVGSLPSVTTILNVISKPALVPWARTLALEHARAALLDSPPPPENYEVYLEWVEHTIAKAKAWPDQVKDQAADFGTRLHALIEGYIKAPQLPLDIPEDMRPPFDAFLAWQEESQVTIHLAEFMVYSQRRGYAGTVDAIATRGDELIVVDWKTSNAVYPVMALQLGAYGAALEEMLDDRIPVAETWVLRLGKTKPEFEARRAPEGAYEGFDGALTLFSALQNVKKAWKKR